MPVLPQSVFVILLLIWLVLFLFGKLQYDRLRKRTLEMALAKAEELRRRDRTVTVEECYQALMPDWEAMLKKTTWFIPHKTELWPMPATPAYVRRRMNLTPLWLGALLRVNGYRLEAAPELQSGIDEIAKNADRVRKMQEAARRRR